jgi:hypothetical protein
MKPSKTFKIYIDLMLASGALRKLTHPRSTLSRQPGIKQLSEKRPKHSQDRLNRQRCGQAERNLEAKHVKEGGCS